jgi:tRNA nucleotidyltransferase/poly(A) polymerase
MNNLLLQLFLIVQNRSANTWLVGGCVRDLILGMAPKDYDIVTDANIEELKEEFLANGWAVNAVGENFLVYAVSKEHQQFEIANFRKEYGFTDGRRPDHVEIGTLEEDAQRRDFTVNSIYWNPITNEYKDPNNGKKDLQNKVLRFIGKPKDRIKEDYLRVFRFYRFLSKFKKIGMEAEPRSLSACREMFREAYGKTNPERVRMEIERMSLT